MAVLQSSGAISLANIQSVMGGAAPTSLSEYYRGGAYTPATKTVTQSLNGYEGPMFYYAAGTPRRAWIFMPPNNGPYIAWFGTYNGSTPSPGANIIYASRGNVTSISNPDGTYYRGAFQYNQVDSYYGSTFSYYAISRSGPYTLVTTQNINTNVPSSGTIRLSNFYGAEKP